MTHTWIQHVSCRTSQRSLELIPTWPTSEPNMTHTWTQHDSHINPTLLKHELKNDSRRSSLRCVDILSTWIIHEPNMTRKINSNASHVNTTWYANLVDNVRGTNPNMTHTWTEHYSIRSSLRSVVLFQHDSHMNPTRLAYATNLPHTYALKTCEVCRRSMSVELMPKYFKHETNTTRIWIQTNIHMNLTWHAPFEVCLTNSNMNNSRTQHEPHLKCKKLIDEFNTRSVKLTHKMTHIWTEYNSHLNPI